MKLLNALMVTLIGCLGTPAFAHGDETPQHGGMVKSVRETAYELAPHPKGLMLYVEDHGNPVSTAGVSGKLVLSKGAQRTEAELKPDGANRMLASGINLVAGQRATAVLTMPSGAPILIHFPAK